jgi:small subunit ribosomal protein S4
MARYIGPKTKIARRFREPIFGADKVLEKRNFPPGQHGNSRKRSKPTEYAIQLSEKQKAKYTYGVLERQFYKTFEEAARKRGITGENLLKFLEARLDNTVYRLGIAPTRAGARQLVSHRHVTVNGKVVNISSYSLKPGDVVAVREKSKTLEAIVDAVKAGNAKKFNWLNWDEKDMKGTFLAMPERDQIPENIKEQLIVELYSK